MHNPTRTVWQLQLQQGEKPQNSTEKTESVLAILHKLKVRYPNLMLAKLNLSRAVEGTPYETVVASGQLAKSSESHDAAVF